MSEHSEHELLPKIEELATKVSMGCEVPVVLARDEMGNWILVVNEHPICVSSELVVIWTFLEGMATGVQEALMGSWNVALREHISGQSGGWHTDRSKQWIGSDLLLRIGAAQ